MAFSFYIRPLGSITPTGTIHAESLEEAAEKAAESLDHKQIHQVEICRVGIVGKPEWVTVARALTQFERPGGQ